ncbi:hypothetical protein JD969_20695 [Planctomycetota bacterium]|nr:hypothetical protein JD969_20695 [Planctomycetota bacterium]
MNEHSPHYEMAMRGLFEKRSNAGEVQKKKDLEDRIDRLSLVCMAMWSLLQDKTNLTEADLLERVRAIDLMDGVEDGKATKTISKCQSCGRTMSQRHQRCLYCGAEKLASSAFDKI